MHRIWTLATLPLIAAAAVLSSSAPALAHARWKSSTPDKGEVLTSPPSSVEITFTQEIQKIAGGYGIQVNKDRGLDVTAGPAVVSDADRHKLSVPLQQGLTPGRYVVRWNNTSDADADPAEGAFSFYIGTGPNSVDLENDRQLEQIGAEEEGSPTAPAGTSPTAATTGGATAARTASATPTAVSGTSSDGGSNNGWWILLAVIAGGIVIGGAAGYYIVRRRP